MQSREGCSYKDLAIQSISDLLVLLFSYKFHKVSCLSLNYTFLTTLF